MTTLQELFMLSKGQPIEVDGKTVSLAARIPCQVGDHFTLRFIRSRDENQGVRLSLKRGLLQICDARVEVDTAPYRDLVFWRSTAPDEIHFRVVKALSGELLVYNCWRGKSGRTDAWLVNAGILVKLHGSCWRLHCSNGYGDASFDDVVVEVSRHDTPM